MDKQVYKEMLSEALSESERLLLLVAKYKDEKNDLKKLIYKHPNNFELGKIVRNMFTK